MFTNSAIADSDSADSDSAYSIVPNWPNVPKHFSMGQATGVAVDSHNHVFIFHRASREWTVPFPIEKIIENTVLMFDGATGELKNSWGGGLFIMPHGLSVDKENNVWVTDVGSQQIYKLSHDGELLFSIGEAGVLGKDKTHFALPSDLSILEDGSVYVSDGYVNTRVIKFDSSGTFQMQWGSPGDKSGEFDLPHGISASNNRVYVADRGNSRVQIFDNDGTYISEWNTNQVGRPYGVAVSNDENVFIIDGGDQPDSTRSRVVILDTDGNVLNRFSAEDESDEKNLGHDIALGLDGAVYVVDAWASSVRKYTKSK
jgi:peptidylamidoglycolate lyase